MTSQITITLPNVTVPPPSSGSQQGASNPQVTNPSAQSPQDNSQTNTSGTQANSSGSANNTNNSNAGNSNASSNGNTKFSTVLAASQHSNTSQNTPSQGSAAGQSTQPQDTTGTDTSGTGTTGTATGGTNLTSDIASLLLTLQAQVQNATTQGTGAGADTNAVTGGQSTLTSQDDNLLQELQQLLQQLLSQATSLTQGTQTTGSTQDSSGSSNTQQQGTGSNPNDGSLAQLMSQLVNVLNQITQQPDFQSLSSDLNSLSVTSDGQSATTILAQFAQSIQNGLGQTAGSSAAGNTNTSATSGVFDKLVSTLMNATGAGATIFTGAAAGQGDTTSGNANSSTQDPATQLQSALSDIVSIFAAAGTGAPATPDNLGSGNNDSDTNNNSNNNTNVNAAAVPVINNTQVPSTDFVKLTQAATQPAPVADQVLVQIQNAVKTGANIITIQLSPADLGKVNVQLVTGSNGQTNINITADNRATLAMLQSEAQSLQSALRDVGLKTNMGGLNFNLGGQQQNTSNFNGNQGGYTQVAQPVDSIDDGIDYGTTIAYYQMSVQSGLNIMV